MSGRFIAVVGPSGVGKDSVMAAVAASSPTTVLAHRTITRPTDYGGEVYDGVDVATFKQMRDDGAFALWWPAHGLYYGIPAGIQDDLAEGLDVLANISRGMLHKAKELFPDMIVIVLTAQRDLLAARLAARGREDADEIAKRLDRKGYALPEDLDAHEISNDGPLAETVAAVQALLSTTRAT